MNKKIKGSTGIYHKIYGYGEVLEETEDSLLVLFTEGVETVKEDEVRYLDEAAQKGFATKQKKRELYSYKHCDMCKKGKDEKGKPCGYCDGKGKIMSRNEATGNDDYDDGADYDDENGDGYAKDKNKKRKKELVGQKEDNTNDESDDGEGMDKVQPKALKKKFKDRKDKDIDNDGDEDESDEYLHNRRKKISKEIQKEEVEQIDEGKWGIYRKSRSPTYDGNDAHNSSAHTLVKRGGKHLTFKNEKAAQAWIDKNSEKGKEFLTRKVSKYNIKMEGVEQIDELSYKTLKRARDAGYANDRPKLVKKSVRSMDKKVDNLISKLSDKEIKKMSDRKFDKILNKEEVDEMSSKRMEAYVAAMRRMHEAKVGVAKQTSKAHDADDHDEEREKDGNKFKDAHKEVDVNDTDEKGHDDMERAGRATKQAPARNGDNLNNGDPKTPPKK